MCDDAEVYRKYADELVRFATATSGPASADDVVSAAVLGAMSSPRWRMVENKRAYLYRAVVNEAMRTRRTTQRRLRDEIRSSVREGWVPSHVDRDVIVALHALSVRQRAVVFLTYWADLSAAETADVVGVSLRTIERELSRAKSRLERLLS